MHVVLSLDPGDHTGWALYREGDAKPRAGVANLPDLDKNLGNWANAFREWVVGLARLEGVTHIVSEAPIIVTHGKNNAPDINVVIKHVAILVAASMCADELGIPQPTRASRSTVSKHFTALVPGMKLDNGERVKRKMLKDYFIANCMKKGWDVGKFEKRAEDVADALGTLDWYCFDRKIKTGWDSRPSPGPLFQARGVHIDTVKGGNTALLQSALRHERKQPPLGWDPEPYGQAYRDKEKPRE